MWPRYEQAEFLKLATEVCNAVWGAPKRGKRSKADQCFAAISANDHGTNEEKVTRRLSECSREFSGRSSHQMTELLVSSIDILVMPSNENPRFIEDQVEVLTVW